MHLPPVVGTAHATFYRHSPSAKPSNTASKLSLALQHIGIYAYRVNTLQQFTQLPPAPIEPFESLEQLRALWRGWRIAVYQAKNAPHGGVDTPEDLEAVRAVWVQHGNI